MQYTTLSPLEGYEWNTPELVKARNACNKEIESILQERQRIDLALQALTSADVIQLDFSEIEAQRDKFMRDRLKLKQQELKFRSLTLKGFLKQANLEGEQKGKEFERKLEEVSQKVAKGLESIGYLQPRGHGIAVPGTWEQAMILKHPAYREAVRLLEEAHAVSTNYDPARQNDKAIESLQAELSKALTQLVG